MNFQTKACTCPREAKDAAAVRANPTHLPGCPVNTAASVLVGWMVGGLVLFTIAVVSTHRSSPASTDLPSCVIPALSARVVHHEPIRQAMAAVGLSCGADVPTVERLWEAHLDAERTEGFVPLRTEP